MQQIFDAILDPSIDATNPHEAAIWTLDEANVSAYKIVGISSVPGALGVYSYADPYKKAYLNFDGGESSFSIDADGTMKVHFGDEIDNFGQQFGFFWETNGGTFYTEDEKNRGAAMSLSYLMSDGTNVDLTDDTLQDLKDAYASNDYTFLGGLNRVITAQGDNDWILGFEDGTDGDFQDAVFYVEDMKPVPEPATMLLLGTGLLGIAAFGRKKLMKRS